MKTTIESFVHCDKAVTLQDTQISSDGRAITSQLLGKLGDALLCFTPKNTLQKHILSDLQTTGCKSSVIDLSERLRCIADSCACTGKCPLHDVSIYPHLANVKGLSELSTQQCDRRRRCSSEAYLVNPNSIREKIQHVSWWTSYPNDMSTRILVGKVTSFMLGFTSTTRTWQARSRAIYLHHSMLIPQVGSGFSRRLSGRFLCFAPIS